MNTATISTKGQLVIPTRFRKALHLQAGDKVSLTLEGDRLLLEREQPRRARLVETSRKQARWVPADLRAARLPALTSHAHVTDAYFVELARAHRLKLATLDDELYKKPWAIGIAENPL